VSLHPNDTKFSRYEAIAHLRLPEEVRINTGIIVVVVSQETREIGFSPGAALFEVADAEDWDSGGERAFPSNSENFTYAVDLRLSGPP